MKFKVPFFTICTTIFKQLDTLHTKLFKTYGHVQGFDNYIGEHQKKKKIYTNNFFC